MPDDSHHTMAPAAPHTEALTTHFVPAPAGGRRLMVVLHGLGDSLEGFTVLPHLLGLPSLNYLLVNAPDPYVIGYAWYDIERPEPGVLRSRARLQRLLANLAAQGWAPADTVLFGFSQGCLMALDVALRHPEPFAGIVGVSGYLFAPERLEAELHPRAREQAVLMTHGTHDELLPVERTRAQAQSLQRMGVAVAWHEFPKAHTLDPAEELPLIRRWVADRWPDAP